MGDIQPYSQFLVGLGASAFAGLIIFLFYILVGEGFDYGENLGQVGDFIGGLINPALSFIALIVLLRTTLIQTGEARKTAQILLEQQRLFEVERFEASYYALYDRLDGFAEKYARVATSDGSTLIKKLVNKQRDRREALNALPLRQRYKGVIEYFTSTMIEDKSKKLCLAMRRVFDHIDSSDLSLAKKRYYAKLFFDAVEPAELVLFLNCAFSAWPSTRKRLRKYRPARNIHAHKFMVDLIADYFSIK